jgi:hypothetical protein
MRLAQIVVPNASEYERKCQRADQEALASKVELVALKDAQVAHVYASGPLPTREFIDFPVPYVATAPVEISRWSLRKPRVPAAVVPAVGEKALQEAVEEAYWGPALPRREGEARIIGSYARPSVRNVVEQTLVRIHRFREDVTWNLFDHVPTREDLSGVDVWVDPAMDESDLDGFVAEALVVGLPVVASRVGVNAQRLENGRTGWLVPPGDPNEMTHAILAALFKPEVAENKVAAARQTISKFRARQRVRVLGPLYETLIP